MQLSKEQEGHQKRFKNERHATVKRWLDGMNSKQVMNLHAKLREKVKWDVNQYEVNDQLWFISDIPQVVKYMQDVTYRGR